MSNALNKHQHYLKLAIQEAQKTQETGDVPVGALIVKADHIIAKAHNTKEQTKLPTSHAELLAIEVASKALGDWRLTGCTLYSSLEPCPMCAGAILNARLDAVVYAARDFKWGAAQSRIHLFEPALFNHNVCTHFIEMPEAAALLKTFFKALRNPRIT